MNHQGLGKGDLGALCALHNLMPFSSFLSASEESKLLIFYICKQDHFRKEGFILLCVCVFVFGVTVCLYSLSYVNTCGRSEVNVGCLQLLSLLFF